MKRLLSSRQPALRGRRGGVAAPDLGGTSRRPGPERSHPSQPAGDPRAARTGCRGLPERAPTAGPHDTDARTHTHMHMPLACGCRCSDQRPAIGPVPQRAGRSGSPAVDPKRRPDVSANPCEARRSSPSKLIRTGVERPFSMGLAAIGGLAATPLALAEQRGNRRRSGLGYKDDQKSAERPRWSRPGSRRIQLLREPRSRFSDASHQSRLRGCTSDRPGPGHLGSGGSAPPHGPDLDQRRPDPD